MKECKINIRYDASKVCTTCFEIFITDNMQLDHYDKVFTLGVINDLKKHSPDSVTVEYQVGSFKSDVHFSLRIDKDTLLEMVVNENDVVYSATSEMLVKTVNLAGLREYLTNLYNFIIDDEKSFIDIFNNNIFFSQNYC